MNHRTRRGERRKIEYPPGSDEWSESREEMWRLNNFKNKCIFLLNFVISREKDNEQEKEDLERSLLCCLSAKRPCEISHYFARDFHINWPFLLSGIDKRFPSQIGIISIFFSIWGIIEHCLPKRGTNDV